MNGNEITTTRDHKAIPRDDKGRFLPGHSGGPGRPPAEKEQHYYNLTIGTVTEKDWLQIVKKAVADAKEGDRWAREWLGNYVLGKPVQRIDAQLLDRSLQVIFVDDWRDEDD